jgi:hypothetical protein
MVDGACMSRGLMTEDQIVRFSLVSSRKERRPGVRLSSMMTLIACIAVSLRLPTWLDSAGFHPLASWETHRQQLAAIENQKRRENAAYESWRGPIAIQVTRHDELGSVLANFREAATARESLPRYLEVYVDPAGLREAGQSLTSPIGIDLDVKTMPARVFLRTVLEPLNLGCRLVDDMVMVTSKRSHFEPIEYGHHGEVCCEHGECLNIRTLNLRLPVTPVNKP